MDIRARLDAILDVFSRRKGPEHQRPELSDSCRGRLGLLYRDVTAGNWRGIGPIPGFWPEVYNALQHLHGRAYLTEAGSRGPEEDLNQFLSTCSANHFFDFIELGFKLEHSQYRLTDGDLVDALNRILEIEEEKYRVTRHAVVRERDRGITTMRISQYPRVVVAEEKLIHEEGIEPALELLGRATQFQQADAEFRDALAKYRDNRFRDSIAACGSSLESVLKVLCATKRLPFKETDSLSTLLQEVMNASSLESFFVQPIQLIGTLRNRLSSAHGAGEKAKAVGPHVAQYALTSTAAAIVLLLREIKGE